MKYVNRDICINQPKSIKFKDYIHNRNVYIFQEPRSRKSWIEYVYSNNERYFNKYHDNINISKG